MSSLFVWPTPAAHRRCCACFAALLLALAGAQLPAQPLADAGLTLDAALRLAQARSRQLPAQDAAATAARHMAVAAGQRPDPVIKGGLNNLPIDGPDRFRISRDFMTVRSIGVMQEFTAADKRLARSARYDREAELAQAGHAMALAELRRETANAWLECYYRERILGLVQRMRAEADLQVAAADAAYRGGRGALADVFAARSAVAMLDDRLQLMAREVATARTGLARWVGDSGNGTLAEAPVMDRLPLQLATLETALEGHPQIAALAQQELLARAEADVARSAKQSDWSAELMFSQRGPAYANMVSLSFSVPWQWDSANRQDRELAAKLALAQRAHDSREEALRDTVARTRNAVLSWQNNRERLAHFDTSLLPLAGDRVRAALAAYRGASGPLAAVLEARRAELDAQLERLRIALDSAGLWAQLNHLIPAEHAGPAAKEP